MTVDILVKSYGADREWFRYCLRSIVEFTTQFRRLVLVIPACDETVFREFPLPAGTVLAVSDEPSGDSYLIQQIQKLYADTFTDSEFLCFLDSDTIFTRPVTPLSFCVNYNAVNMPYWLMTPWEKTETPWRPIVEKFMGQPVEFEFMRRAPQLVPRWLLAEVRGFCLKQHGVPLDQYVMSQPHRAFSEFNVMGAYAYQFHRYNFYWINTAEVPENEWPELTVDQRYSWGGLTPEIEAEFERILGPASEFISPAPNGTAETATTQSLTVSSSADHVLTLPDRNKASGRLERVWDEVPWTDKESSLAEIGRLSSRLKQFCTGPVRTRQVRDVLRENGVIK